MKPDQQITDIILQVNVCYSVYTISYCCFRKNHLKSLVPHTDVENQSLILVT